MKLVLLTLFAVLALAEPAAADKKNDKVPDGTVSTIRDERIVESSGLALSTRHADLAYTINDRGTDPMVYAIRVSTGAVVGDTDLGDIDVEDTESITVDASGTLWLGDLGDNDHERDSVSIFSFPEPGPGDQRVTTVNQYDVTFPGGPLDAEGLLVHPTTQDVHLVSKNGSARGTIYAVTLRAGETVQAKQVAEAPRNVTDATFTNDGRWALLRTEDDVWIYDPKTWQPVDRFETPDLQQAESITVERGNRSVLLGSEGENSPIVRVALPDLPDNPAPIELTDPPAAGSRVPTPLVLGVTGVLLVLGIALARRRGRV